jgi:hypothetical protein
VTQLDRIEEKLDELDKRTADIEQTMAKQRGFVAGFAAAFTLLWGSVIGLGIYIWQKHFGG